MYLPVKFFTDSEDDWKFSKSSLFKCTFKPKMTFQRVRSDGPGTDVCLCIISQYADAEVKPMGWRVEKSTLTTVMYRVKERDVNVRLAMDSALSKCFSQGVLVPDSQIVAVMEHTSQSHAL